MTRSAPPRPAEMWSSVARVRAAMYGGWKVVVRVGRMPRCFVAVSMNGVITNRSIFGAWKPFFSAKSVLPRKTSGMKWASSKRMLQIPYELEQEEDGTWAAHASFPSGGAHGLGDTPEEALADLYEAVNLMKEFVAAL
ncbi:type II toxin-antitoxin system HicB family antitoxin [Parafrankia colletiae]